MNKWRLKSLSSQAAPLPQEKQAVWSQGRGTLAAAPQKLGVTLKHGTTTPKPPSDPVHLTQGSFILEPQ